MRKSCFIKVVLGLCLVASITNADSLWHPATPWDAPEVVKDGDVIPTDAEGSDQRALYYDADGAHIFIDYSCLYSNLHSEEAVTGGDQCSKAATPVKLDGFTVEAPYVLSYRNKNERTASTVLRSGKRGKPATGGPVKILVKNQKGQITEINIVSSSNSVTLFCKSGKCSLSRKGVSASL